MGGDLIYKEKGRYGRSEKGLERKGRNNVKDRKEEGC